MSAPQIARRVIRASRPVSWINTAYPFAAGCLLAAREVDWALVLGTLFFLIPYNVVIYGVNDIFDWESDSKNPRKGGIEGDVVEDVAERARVNHAIMWVAGAGVAVYLLAVLAWGSWPSTIVFLVAVFFAYAYSLPGLRFKERPVLDSFTSAMHFVLPLVYGILLGGGPILSLSVWPIVIAFVLWAMASHAFGAVQDILPDRAGGIASIATWLGARRTTRLSVGLYLAASATLLLLEWPRLVVAILPLAYVAMVAPYVGLHDGRSHEAHDGWRMFLWLNQATGALVTAALIGVAQGIF